MRIVIHIFLALFIWSFMSCSKDNPDVVVTPEEPNEQPDETSMYFPPTNTDTWETTNLADLNWNEDQVDALYSYLEDSDTRAFIILKDGKIALEKYFGLNVLGTVDFNEDSIWYWASAGKTITSLLIGIAQQENHLNINDITSDYLGLGWTSLDEEKEALITIKNQLCMNTGLNYNVPAEDEFCTMPSCLTFSADAGTEWYYYNPPYLLLKDVITAATSVDFSEYSKNKLENIIGMDGDWLSLTAGVDNLELYWSNARTMARFGLLILNEGTWNDTKVLDDANYFTEMTNTSQSLNEAYGYLWWLNGKSSVIYPGTTLNLNLELAPNAPDDLIAAIGKNGQYIDVIPSENMVVIRMGESPDNSAVPITFHNEMWELINAIITN